MSMDSLTASSETRDADAVEVSIIVPAMEEGENIPLLVPRIAEALKGRGYEIIIVDDGSRDHTQAVCAELSRSHPLTLLVREKPQGGVSGAVLHGMARARGTCLVVMDADLQHPPESLPQLLAPLEDGADFVIGSRYAGGGTVAGGWSLSRRLNSWVATLLARPFTGRVSDPMSGFFALRRASYLGADRLTPLGYKIGLELMCKCHVQDIREIPIHFATRRWGRSKLTAMQQIRYVEHLSRLYDFRFPRLSPIVKFIVVIACGMLAGAAIALRLHDAGWSAAQAVSASYLGAIGITALFHLRYVRTRREFLIRPQQWIDFVVFAIIEWLVCTLGAMWFDSRVGGDRLVEMFLFCYLGATIARYVLRKEFLHDIRGLRQEIRKGEIIGQRTNDDR